MISAFGVEHGDYEISKAGIPGLAAMAQRTGRLKPVQSVIGGGKSAMGSVHGQQALGGLKAAGAGMKQAGSAGKAAWGGLGTKTKLGIGGGAAAVGAGGGYMAMKPKKQGMSGLTPQ